VCSVDCRIVRMVTHPVIGAISNMLWSFNSSKATLRAFHSCRSASCHQYHRHCSVQSGACTKSAYPIFCAGCSLMVWCSHVAAAVAVMGTVTYFIALGPCVCSQVNWCIDILLRCTYIYTNIHTYICILVRCQTSYC